MIRALLVKELWDLRGMLALSTLGYLYWLFSFSHMTLPEWRRFQNPHALPFEPGGFVQSLIVYASVVAAALGLYQGLADSSSVRLQFILSRPLSWIQLIVAKAAIGLVLWAIGCFGVVLAAVVLSEFFPIYPGPLEAWMLIDCLGWLALGSTIYLGGFLSALRPGWWMGTRLLPLLGAIGWWYIVLFPLMLNQYKFHTLSFFAGNQSLFFISLLISNFLLLLSIVYVSAHSGEFPPAHFPGFSGRLLKATAAFGVAFFLSVGFFSLIVLGYSFFGGSLPRDAQDTTRLTLRRESLGISSAGRPFITRFDRLSIEPVPLDDRVQASLNKINAGFKLGDKVGSPANLPLVTGFLSFDFLLSTRNELYDHLLLVDGATSNLLWSKQYYPYLNCKQSDEILPMAISKNEIEFWYLFLHRTPTPHAYFAGFSFQSRLPLGFIGKSGLQPHRPALADCFQPTAFEQSVANPLAGEMFGSEHSFPVASWSHRKDRRDTPLEVAYSPVWLATDEGIVACDLAGRTVTLISPLKDVKKLTYFSDRDKEKSFPIAITGDQVHVLEPGGKLVAKANYKVDFYKNNAFFLTHQNDLIIVEDNFDWRKYQSPAPEDHVSVSWFEKNGDLKESKKMVLHVTAERTPDSEKVPIVQPMFLFDLISGFSGAALDLFVDRTSASEAIKNYFQRHFPWMAGATVISLALCFWRQRRYSENGLQTLGWLCFIALFGVSGWFGYRFHKRWPLLIRCESCAAKRPVNQKLCPHCQAAWTQPAPAVTPIFAPAPSSASTSLNPQTV